MCGDKLFTALKICNQKLEAKFLFTTIYGLRVSSKTNTSIKELKEVAAMALGVLH